MKKKYVSIKFSPGKDIESAINELKNRKCLVCGSFDGHILYSDVDDIDSAYKKITGKTKSEFDAEIKSNNDRYEDEKIKYNEKIPELTEQWIEKGKEILDKKYHEIWAECVPIRLDDLYRGMELGLTLDIVKELNDGCEFDVAKEIIEGQ